MGHVLFSLVLVLLLGACGGSSSGTAEDDDDDEVTAEASAGAAVTAVFSSGEGEGSVSEAALINQVKGLLVRQAYAKAAFVFTACDAVNDGAGPSGVTMSESGNAGTYGTSSDPLTVADADTCANGGDVAFWSIDASAPVAMNCSDGTSSFTVSMSGSGVFHEAGDDTTAITNIAGAFDIALGSDTAQNVDCSFTVTGGDGSTGETFDGGCENTDGVAVAQSSGVDCEDPA